LAREIPGRPESGSGTGGQACQENKKLPDNSISGNPLMKYAF